VSRTSPLLDDLKPALLGLVCAVLVLVLADLTVLHALPGSAANFDESVRTAVHAEAVPWLTRVITLGTWLGSTPVLVSLVLLFLLTLRRGPSPSQAWFPVAAFAAAEILTESTKTLCQTHSSSRLVRLANFGKLEFPQRSCAGLYCLLSRPRSRAARNAAHSVVAGARGPSLNHSARFRWVHESLPRCALAHGRHHRLGRRSMPRGWSDPIVCAVC